MFFTIILIRSTKNIPSKNEVPSNKNVPRGMQDREEYVHIFEGEMNFHMYKHKLRNNHAIGYNMQFTTL